MLGWSDAAGRQLPAAYLSSNIPVWDLNTTVLMVGDIAGQLVVASPLYRQHYDLQTGACLEDDAEQVDVYSVRLEGDSVLIAR